MRKLLLVAVAIGGLMGLAGTQASAAPAAFERHAAPSVHATNVDYYYNHHRWHHRHWEHNHWRYYD